MKPGTWGLIFLLFFMTIICGASAGKMIPLVPDLARDLGVSIPKAAWLISAITVVAAIIAPFSGIFSDKFGDKTIIIIGLVAVLLGNIFDYISPSFGTMLASRLFEGIGFISIALGASAMMARTSGHRMSIAMAIISVGVPLGVGLGLFLAGTVAGPAWRVAFLGHAALAGLCLLGAFLLPKWEPVKHESGEIVKVKWSSVAFSRAPLLLALGAGLNSIVMFGFGALYPQFVGEHYHLDPHTASSFGILSYPASVIGSLAVGKVLEKAKNLRIIVIGVVGTTAVLGALIFLPNISLQISAVLLFLYYLVGGSIGAFAMARFAAVSPSPAAIGITASMFMQLANIGMLISPPIVFSTYASSGSAGMAILSIICLGLTILVWMDPKISPTGKEA